MSISLTKKQLNDGVLIEALKELGREKFAVKTAWNISRILRQIDKVLINTRKDFEKATEAFYLKDAEGNKTPIMSEEVKDDKGVVTSPSVAMPNQFVFVEGKDPKDVEVLFKEMLEQDATIESNKIRLQELGTTKLSAHTVMALEPVLSTLELA